MKTLIINWSFHPLTKQYNMSEDTFIKAVFTQARTYRFFQNKQIDKATLKQLYEVAKFAPSASNLCPLRISFVTSEAQKQKVIEAAASGNQPKIASAPVVVIVAYDSAFDKYIDTLSPHMNADSYREQDFAKRQQVAIENSWLQAGVLITAARALGLDCGPMSGFNKSEIDAAFYSQSSWRSAFLMNLGYGDESKIHPRGNRLEFDEACEIL